MSREPYLRFAKSIPFPAGQHIGAEQEKIIAEALEKLVSPLVDPPAFFKHLWDLSEGRITKIGLNVSTTEPENGKATKEPGQQSLFGRKRPTLEEAHQSGNVSYQASQSASPSSWGPKGIGDAYKFSSPIQVGSGDVWSSLISKRPRLED